MSGLCSAHQGHDPSCKACTAVPLTDEERAYYRGWNERYRAMRRHGWCPIEDQVIDAYEKLEKAARASIEEIGDPALEGALDVLDHLRDLKRGFRKPFEDVEDPRPPAPSIPDHYDFDMER